MAQVVSPTIADRVTAVLATAASWTHGRRRADGREFWIVPGSNGRTYFADAIDCSCPSASLSAVKTRCKHSQAVALFLASAPAATAQPAPAPLSCNDCGAELPAHVISGAMCSACWNRREAAKQDMIRAERAAYRARLRADLGLTEAA